MEPTEPTEPIGDTLVDDAAHAGDTDDTDDMVDDDLLVEEISIDGMCGVY